MQQEPELKWKKIIFPLFVPSLCYRPGFWEALIKQMMGGEVKIHGKEREGGDLGKEMVLQLKAFGTSQ